MSDEFTRYFSRLDKDFSRGIATEHTYRPTLKELIESFDRKVSATNEPKREACGAPDFIVFKGNSPIGYIECKDIGISLDEEEKSEQVKRYRSALGNLILTDYLEFRLFVGGEKRAVVKLGSVNSQSKLRRLPAGESSFKQLMAKFLEPDTPTITTPRQLAQRMAKIARLIQNTILIALAKENKRGNLTNQLNAFREVLLHDLSEASFADMYAQTISYGLFAARCNIPEKEAVKFSREHAAYDIPPTNLFLREMLHHIAGPNLDKGIAWSVDDLAELLRRADIESILRDFGRRIREEDPVIHFYETFLSEYDPKMRETRGVYFTPEPVVNYIVRSVDYILKTDFNLECGLADQTKIRCDVNNHKISSKETKDVHKVQILDPATGTGTFLYGVINRIFEDFVGNEGMWCGYVREHLLPRLYGFELLMAPYTVAHMKLGLLLKQTGYDFGTEERLNIFLTNSLEQAQFHSTSLFAQKIAEEANSASDVKQNKPIMVIIGNPPYSGHSANRSWYEDEKGRRKETFIGKLVRDYYYVDGKPLMERNPKWLQDDYVKFIRFAQWRIEQTGYGILAFITNHGYLDNPTFRGMRQNLMNSFDDIYIVDLHGNSKKKETCPDGSKDENVFDIQQGVAIGIFVKKPSQKKKTVVRHVHCYGLREDKSNWLMENYVKKTNWEKLIPESPYYLFIPQQNNLLNEWERYFKVSDIFNTQSVGIVTARDKLTIHWNEKQVWDTVRDFASLSIEEAREKYQLGPDARDWKVHLAQQDVRDSGPRKSNIHPILYRPFDIRFTYYTGKTKGFICMPRQEVMRHMISGNNISLCFHRREELDINYSHFLATRLITEHGLLSSKTTSYQAPLYIYPDPDINGELFNNGLAKHVNLNEQPTSEISRNLNLKYISDSKGDLKNNFGPEDIFYYIYAILHSPTYRDIYAEFLRIDFPRIPTISNKTLFRKLCHHGEELAGLHLMETKVSHHTKFPVRGDNIVEKIRYTAPGEGTTSGRVWINDKQYIECIPPEVWEFHIGGYQVCGKWLKDRKGLELTFDDLSHYQYIISAINETIRIMDEIDRTIESHGAWPIK